MSNEPVAIQWELNGDKECGYTNWLGITPFGRILITWKSWKDFPEASVDEFPGGFEACGDPDDVKEECELEFAKRFRIAAPDDTALLRQALEALEGRAANRYMERLDETITALRERLGEKT